MNEKELQQAFLQFLAQKSGAKNQKELEKYVQSLGEDGLKQAYAEFQQVLQKQAQKAAHGAKLNYFKRLKNQCPDGEELVYYRSGGSVKCGCKKASEGMEMPAPKKKPNKNQVVNDFNKDYQKKKPNNTKLDPKTTKTLPNGKYPSNWTSDDRMVWERTHGDNNEGAATTKNKGVGKNEKGGNIKKNCGGIKLKLAKKGNKVC